MVEDLFFNALLLVGLRWLGGIVYEAWLRHRSTTSIPTTRKPATPLPKPSRTPKPFPGLTCKPRCAACEQAPEPGSLTSRVPPPRLLSSQGRPRQVDTSAQFCPQPHCAYYGWMGLGNIRANGYPNRGRWRQFQCRSCQHYFLETQ